MYRRTIRMETCMARHPTFEPATDASCFARPVATRPRSASCTTATPQDPRLPSEAFARSRRGDGTDRRDVRPGLAVAGGLIETTGGGPRPRGCSGSPGTSSRRRSAGGDRAGRPGSPGDGPRPLASTTVDDTWLDGLDEDLETALAALPDGQRRAIELRVLADQAYEDVARELDITPDTARVRVHRGLTAIRRRLAEPSGNRP